MTSADRQLGISDLWSSGSCHHDSGLVTPGGEAPQDEPLGFWCRDMASLVKSRVRARKMKVTETPHLGLYISPLSFSL